MATTSPNARTRELYREQGYICEIVEKWNSFVKIRQDFLGIFDLLMFKDGRHIGVQATTNDHTAERIEKLAVHLNTRRWMDTGGEVLVIGWAKLGARGKRKEWTHKEIWLDPTNLKTPVLPRENDPWVVELPLGLPTRVGPDTAGGLG